MLKTAHILIVALCFVPLPAMADSLVFTAQLTGDQEVPPVMSTTSGNMKLRANSRHTQLTFDLKVTDGTAILGGPGAHIHCAPSGENGPVVVFLAGGVPVGFDGGLRVWGTISDDKIINAACGGTIVELMQAFVTGNAYVNVHSSANPGGEIRGQIYQSGSR